MIIFTEILVSSDPNLKEVELSSLEKENLGLINTMRSESRSSWLKYPVLGSGW